MTAPVSDSPPAKIENATAQSTEPTPAPIIDDEERSAFHAWQRANEAPTVYSDPTDWRLVATNLAEALRALLDACDAFFADDDDEFIPECENARAALSEYDQEATNG